LTGQDELTGFLHDAVLDLKKRIRDAKAEMKRAPKKREKGFHYGVAWGALEALSIIKDRAGLYGISLTGIGLDGFDFDKEAMSLSPPWSRTKRR
jgi:hypothetical protein